MDRRQVLLRGAAFAVAAPALTVLARPGRASAEPARPTAAGRSADRLPSRGEIIQVLRRVAGQWIAGHEDPGDNGWARATFFSGLMALYRLTGDAAYLGYARSWAEQHSYGVIDGPTTRHADNFCAMQTYLDLYEAEPDDAKLTASEATLQHMLTDQPDKNDDWWWDDALHMAMPPFARFGALLGDTTLWDKLYTEYANTKNVQGGPGLYDPATGLWYRDANFVPGGIVSPNGLPVVWSRGNGWVAAGHAKVLAALPANAAHTDEYRATLTQLVTALPPIQRADGFWDVNLADPDHFPGPETSGTAFFAYGTACAVAAGLVDAATYLPVAARAWNGMVATAVHPDGVLGYVQGTGDRPDSSQPVTYDSTADFGVGAFLLAGTELARLAPGS